MLLGRLLRLWPSQTMKVPGRKNDATATADDDDDGTYAAELEVSGR